MRDSVNYCYYMFFIAAAVLFLALFMEYFLHIKPCELCYLQRLPYLGLLPVCFAAIFSSKLRPQMLIVMLILLAISALLAFVHIGVEQNWPGFSMPCVNNFNLAGSFADFKQSINQQAIVPCNQAQFHFLGFSLPYWNLLISCVLLLTTVWQIYRYDKDINR